MPIMATEPAVQAKKKERVCIFVDASNYHYTLQWDIDYQKFCDYYKTRYELVKIFYYEGQHSKKSFLDQRPGRTETEFLTQDARKNRFFKKMRSLGYTVRTKPISSVYDKTSGRSELKCNFDVELTIDALDQLPAYDTAILCSGDGDFTKLIRYLKGKGKNTIVMAAGERLSTTLREAANKIDSPHLHRKEWERLQQLPASTVQPTSSVQSPSTASGPT
jgi:uncharacterized LabA/DUF88 family protein